MPAGFRVKAGGDWLDAENIVLACEAHNAAKLLEGRLAELLNGIAYSSSIVVALGYDGPPPLPGFGFLIPRKERRRIVACTWVGAKFPNRAPQGMNLARCFLSGEDEPDIAAIHSELKDISGVRGEARFHRIFRWPQSMAQYAVGHAPRVAEIEQLAAGIPGLHLAGNAYSGIGLPDCVRSGQKAAAKIISREKLCVN
jgi:oxygen-dependent protoporphyrinogen oxidase